MNKLDLIAEELSLTVSITDIGTFYKNRAGQYHRLYGPAIIRNDGIIMWRKNGLHHRLDGPAVIWNDGKVEYWINHNLYLDDEYWRHPLVIAYNLGKESNV